MFVQFIGRLQGSDKWGPQVIRADIVDGVFLGSEGFELHAGEMIFDLGRDRREDIAAVLLGVVK